MARVEDLSFSELVQELTRYEHESGPPDLERSIRRRSIDTRLMRLICAEPPADERRLSVRVPGDLPVKVWDGARLLVGALVDLGEGGLRVRLDGDAVLDSDRVDVALDRSGPLSRASANVQWQRVSDGSLDVGLAFPAQAEGARRRLHRLVLDILREMPDPLH